MKSLQSTQRHKNSVAIHTNYLINFDFMKKAHKIFVVDDNRGILAALRLLLKSRGYDCETYDNPANVSASALKAASAVILDMNFKSTVNNGNEGIYWLGRFIKEAPDTPVVLITAYADIDLAVRGIKAGASDFIVKPWDNERLMEVVEGVTGKKSVARSDKIAKSSMVVGESPQMRKLMEIVEKVAPTDANILITGENGTGKGLLAQEIHRRSERSANTLTTVDVGAIPESLFESELFGNVKGAFTGAATSRAGKIENAHGGTLFLDEIGNLPLNLQSKLLTVLQTRQVTRIGDSKPKEIDIRLICATNSDITAMVGAGSFREDLFYRINTICIDLPPLRERPEEIETLAQAFVKEFGDRYEKTSLSLSDAAVSLLKRQSWPGNIRQLRHAMEKAVIMCDADVISPQDFDFSNPAGAHTNPVTSGTLADMEKAMIESAMSACGGNLSAVASRLGITRQTLYNKIRKFGI